MKTIAEQIKWNFETNGDLVIKDKMVIESTLRVHMDTGKSKNTILKAMKFTMRIQAVKS